MRTGPGPTISRRIPLFDSKSVRASLTLEMPRVALDAACGTGRHATRLALNGAAVVGIDTSAEMLAVAQAKSLQFGNLQIQYVQACIHRELPIAPESVDFVVCALALCHVTDLWAGIRPLCQAVRRGGYVLVTDLHPAAVEGGLVTLFSLDGVQQAIETVQHSTETYLTALKGCGAEVLSLNELCLGEAFEREPRGLPESVYETGWRDLPFCLVIACRVSR
jgi:SAM-dependent methyltransferase